MDTPSFKEDHISQIPALQMLVDLVFLNLLKQICTVKSLALLCKNE